MRCDTEIDSVLVCSFGCSNSDVEILEVEVRVDVRSDSSVRFQNGLQVDFDKVVERIDVLLDQSFDGQESREKIPFVLE